MEKECVITPEDKNRLFTAERVGRRFREEREQWAQAQWALNNATFSWRAAAPLRLIETAAKRMADVLRPAGQADVTAGSRVPLPQPAQKSSDMAARPISVIIPTFNAGDEFVRLLAALRAQKGVSPLEIVLVDSGSTDETVAHAAKHGAIVLPIRQEDFSHSGARNLGAAHAHGEYLIFLTQDALPLDEYWAGRMIQPLLDHGIAATTCAEIPRDDADLYSRLAAWLNDRDSGGNCDTIGSMPAQEDFDPMMRNAGLSNVACAISAETFAQYGFRGVYAEDLDLGVRLLRKGCRLAFLRSIRVIHSHTRPPIYFMRRACVNYVNVSRIIPSMPRPNTGWPRLAATACRVGAKLFAYQRFLCAIDDERLSPQAYAERTEDFFKGLSIMEDAEDMCALLPSSGDSDLDSLMEQFYHAGREHMRSAEDWTHLYVDFVKESLTPFFCDIGPDIPAALYRQGGDVLIKRFAMWLGNEMGVFNDDDAPAVAKQIARALQHGV